MDLCHKLYDFIAPRDKPVFRAAVPYGAATIALSAGACYLWMLSSATASMPLAITAGVVAFLAVSVFSGALYCGRESRNAAEFREKIGPAIATTFTGLCAAAVSEFVRVLIRVFAEDLANRLCGRTHRGRRPW